MTKDEADERWGKVIRAKFEEGQLHIFIHDKDVQGERIPLGYIVGDNILIVKDEGRKS